MGVSPSRREPEVHVVVVQSQENGKVDAKVLRQSYTEVKSSRGKEIDYSRSRHQKESNGEDSVNSPVTPAYSDVPSHAHGTSYQDDLLLSSHTEHQGKPHRHSIRRKPPVPTRISLHESRASNFQRRPQAKPVSLVHTSPTTLDTNRAASGTPIEMNQHITHQPMPSSRNSFSSVNKLHFHTTSSPRNSVTTDTALEGRAVGSSAIAGELSPVSERGGNMFELFRTYDGMEDYTVYVREDDGKKFYVDWEEQKWRYFPSSWEERGYFLPIDYNPYEGNQRTSSYDRDHLTSDGRSGEFIHPTKGKLITFLRQETTNVLYFFDETSGTWLPMPLTWERHTPTVSTMIADVQRSCPGWKDAKSIVATLRQCNYSVEECASTYHSIQDDGVLDYSEGGGKDNLRVKMEKKLTEVTSQLQEGKERQRELKTQIELLQNRIEELEIENEQMKKELDMGKEEQRRKSMVYRQQSLSRSYNSRLLDAAAIEPLLKILGEDSRALKAKLTGLRNSAMKGLKGCSSTLQQLSTVLMQLLRAHRRQNKEVQEVRALYRKEALQRRLLYNEVQELRGNIRVFCRCRFDSNGPCAVQFDGEERLVCRTVQGRKKAFEFERIYDTCTAQEKVFEDTKPIITSCVDGYNVCILAYGQTGAGKTYTMTGPRDNPGVNIRSMKELFKICHERTTIKYTMKVSIVEVYNEAVYDLLVPPSEGHEKLQLQKRGKEVVVPGLTEIEVRCMDDVSMVMNEGEKNRTVASTKMNTNSSRSHLLLMLKVEGYDKVSKATSHGRLTLVDLAGSERISRSEATGIRLVEAAAINKSLSALGQVFASIRNSALHIPYRNSKLTYILQPCIGGDSKACMIVNISPLEENLPESVSTLEFGQNVRQTELGKATKHVTRPTV